MKTSRMPVVGAAMALLLGLAAGPSAAESVYVSNQDAGVTILDLNTLKPGASVDLGNSDPRGLGVTPDGKWLLTANRETGDVAVVDTATLKVVRRIKIGKNPEFLRIQPGGKLAFVTFEPSSSGKPPAKGGHGKDDDDDDDDKLPAQVAVIDLKQWKVLRNVVGAPETEGLEFVPDGKHFVITNEGNDTITVHNIASGKQVKKIDLKSHGHRPRGIKVSPDGKTYIVTMENSNNYLVLDSQFKVLKSVPTAEGPYGVAFDKAGKRIVVVGSRGAKLQVFDAATHKTVAEVPVGKRCWHFTFTPDESKLLVACGRSDDMEIIDTASYKVTANVKGFKMPWGVVTYPKASGSLDAP